MRHDTRAVRLMAIVVTVAALLAPTGAGAATAQTPQSYSALRRERLARDIDDALRSRALRFDEAERRITRRTERIRELAGTVEDAGGDVSGVLNMLTASEESMARAAGLEAEAIERFRAVPDSDDRRVAFAAARETGRSAAEALREGRQRLRNAALELRRIAAELRTGRSE